MVFPYTRIDWDISIEVKVLRNIFDFYLTLRGILLYATTFRKSDFLDQLTIKEKRKALLSKLLKHCNQKSKFYRKRFLENNIDPNSNDPFKELSKLPVLTKEEVFNNYEDIKCNTNSTNLSFTTSGSTGQPLKSYTSPNQWIVEQAVIWRSWKRAKYKFRDKIAIFRSYSPEENDPLIKFDLLRNWKYYSIYHLDEKNLKKFSDDLKKWKPKFLRGYPSSLYLLAKFLENEQFDLSIKGIFTASEQLHPEQRNLIEKVFSTKVFDHYGQAETTVMFHDCEYGRMHEDWEYGFSELNKQKNGTYELVGTNLHNYAFPLLRYQTGDIVAKHSNVCKCGRNSMVLDSINGRASDFIVKKCKGMIPITNVFTFFGKFLEIKRFQIQQYKEGEISVAIDFWSSIEKNEHVEIKSLISKFFEQKTIYVKFTHNFILKNEGKMNSFIRSIN